MEVNPDSNNGKFCEPCHVNVSIPRVSPRFRKGVGGRRLATNSAQNAAKTKTPQNCVLLLIRGHRKKGAAKRPEFMVFEGFPSFNPLCPPTPFETSDFRWLRFANQPAPYRGLSGPSGPKCPKSLENVSRGLRAGPGTPKSLQKVSGRVQKDSFDTFRRLSRDFHWEIKGRFPKRVVLANVPSFRFSFRGNIRQNHPFGNHPFVNPRDFPDCSREYLETSHGSGAGGPERHFGTFWALGARRAQETSLRGRLVQTA